MNEQEHAKTLQHKAFVESWSTLHDSISEYLDDDLTWAEAMEKAAILLSEENAALQETITKAGQVLGCEL